MYQQVEIEHGAVPPRRSQLGADVRAEAGEGCLRGRAAARRAAARASRRRARRSVPIEVPQGAGRRAVIELDDRSAPRRRRERSTCRTQRSCPATLPVLPLRETVTFPDTLMPLAVGQERSMQLVNDVLGGDRMLAMVASRDPELETPGPDELYEVGVAGVDRADAEGARRHAADPRPGRRSGCASRLGVRASPTWSPRSRSSRTSVVESPELTRADAQRAGRPSRTSSSRSRTCPRSCSSRSPTSTTPARCRT